jgi:voltage-gated potassium channel
MINKTYHKYIIIGSTIIATLLIASEDTDVGRIWHSYSIFAQQIFFGILTLDFIFRIKKSIRKNKLNFYLKSFSGIIDFIAVVPFVLTFFNSELSNNIKTIFGILSFLKIARFSDALVIFKNVIINERKSLLASLYLMILLTFFLSTILYFVERDINPNGFSSIISSMWWSTITLASGGYGDVAPITVIGKLMAVIAAIVGLGMFALPAGVLINGFAQELARIKYVTGWNLVAKVPIFGDLDKGTISNIARLLFLKRFGEDEMIIKEGDIGDSMYFILDGKVRVTNQNGDINVTLKKGDFFGEIALLKDINRTATVTATRRSEMLELTTYDFKKLIMAKPQLKKKFEEIAQERSCSYNN